MKLDILLYPESSRGPLCLGLEKAIQSIGTQKAQKQKQNLFHKRAILLIFKAEFTESGMDILLDT